MNVTPAGGDDKQQSRAPKAKNDEQQVRVSERRSIPYKEDEAAGAPDKGGAQMNSSSAKKPPSLNMNNLIDPSR